MNNFNQEEKDRFFMCQALQQARCAFAQGEVPVGAVAVYKDEVIAKAHNQVEQLRDASAHAELLCLRRAAEVLGGWRLIGVTLYTTLEPCSLCAGAVFSFRIDRLVWGAFDLRQGAGGSWVDLFSLQHPIHSVSVSSGVLLDESAGLIRAFFQQRRKKV